MPRGFALYEMMVHTPDSIGVLELADGVLISGDGLQGHGVGKYRCSLESEGDYLKTIEKIRRDPRVKSILFSHAYEPWYKDSMIGREAVECCLDDCELYVKKQKCK
jgi:glyoxylase-like metal-dependent hydrolase (beta-lactamase superfamily II)